MNNKNIIKSFIALFTFVSFHYARTCEASDFYISKNYFNNDIVGYYLNSIDIETGATNVLMFDYSLKRNNDDCEINGFELFLDYKITILSADLGFTVSQDFAAGRFKVYNFPDNTNLDIHFKNTDLSFESSYLTGGANISVIKNETGVNVESDALQSSIMQFGKIPNGTYTFSFAIDGCTSSDCMLKESIELYEPVSLELISPGTSNIDQIDEVSIFSTYPVFIWSTDYCSNCDFGIRVCEFNKEKHYSFSEALNDISVLPFQQSNQFYNINNQISTFQYPVNDALELQPGNIYVWQLERKYLTTIGTQSDLSPIYAFKVNEVNTSYENTNTELEIIKRLIGDDEFELLFSANASLNGYSIKESSVMINGKNINMEELNTIIVNLQNGTSIIESIIIE